MNEDKPSIWHYLGAGGGDTETDRNNNKRLALLSMAWAISIITAAAVLTNVELNDWLKWTIALAPNLIAFVTLRSYLNFLRMTDEMQRRIQIEGLAVGFGTGYAFTIGYLVAEAAGAPQIESAPLVLIMTVGWLVGNYMAMRRYR